MDTTAFIKIDNSAIYNSKESVTRYVWSNAQEIFSSSDMSIDTDTSQTNSFHSVTNSNDDVINFNIAFASFYGCNSLPIDTFDSSDFSRKLNRLTYSYINYKSIQNFLQQSEYETIIIDNNPIESLIIITIPQERYKDRILPSSFRLNFNNGYYIRDNYNESEDQTKNQYLLWLFDDQDNFISTIGLIDYPNALILLDFNTINQTFNLNISPCGFYNDGTNGCDTSCYSDIDSDNNGIVDYDPTKNPVAAVMDVISEIKIMSEEIFSSAIFFIDVPNDMFNHSTNPTYYDEDGNILFQSFINFPKTYITTIGLYDSSYNLVAVARFSKPQLKQPDVALKFRLKLTF